jgi:two-component system LytT family sensor kinase
MASLPTEDAPAGALAASPGRWRTWTLVSAFWLTSSLLYAAQMTVMSSMPNERFRLSTLLAWQLPFWLLWIAIAPVILWLGDRFPLDGRQWRRSLPVHGLAWLVLSLLHAASAVGIGRWLAPSASEGFLASFRGFYLSRIHFEVLVYAATLALGYGLEYRRRLRARELSATRLEAQLAHARLDALRMQLNPHFLFNTLHTVAALVRAARNDEAVRMIAGLSDLLRRTLDGQPAQQTPLADELTFLERYLDIQRVRFGDRLRVELRIAPDTRDALVPALILQPLVENALRHGLAPRAAAGLVTIAAARQDGSLQLEVIDNGVGWPDAATRGATVARETEIEAGAGTGVGVDARASASRDAPTDAGLTAGDGARFPPLAGEREQGVRGVRVGQPPSAGAQPALSAASPTAAEDDASETMARGVGLPNTRSRLHHLFGDAASLTLADTPGGGAWVVVRLPYQVAGEGAGARSATNISARHGAGAAGDGA